MTIKSYTYIYNLCNLRLSIHILVVYIEIHRPYFDEHYQY